MVVLEPKAIRDVFNTAVSPILQRAVQQCAQKVIEELERRRLLDTAVSSARPESMAKARVSASAAPAINQHRTSAVPSPSIPSASPNALQASGLGGFLLVHDTTKHPQCDNGQCQFRGKLVQGITMGTYCGRQTAWDATFSQ